MDNSHKRLLKMLAFVSVLTCIHESCTWFGLTGYWLLFVFSFFFLYFLISIFLFGCVCLIIWSHSAFQSTLNFVIAL